MLRNKIKVQRYSTCLDPIESNVLDFSIAVFGIFSLFHIELQYIFGQNLDLKTLPSKHYIHFSCFYQFFLNCHLKYISSTQFTHAISCSHPVQTMFGKLLHINLANILNGFFKQLSLMHLIAHIYYIQPICKCTH